MLIISNVFKFSSSSSSSFSSFAGLIINKSHRKKSDIVLTTLTATTGGFDQIETKLHQNSHIHAGGGVKKPLSPPPFELKQFLTP